MMAVLYTGTTTWIFLDIDGIGVTILTMEKPQIYHGPSSSSVMRLDMKRKWKQKEDNGVFISIVHHWYPRLKL